MTSPSPTNVWSNGPQQSTSVPLVIDGKDTYTNDEFDVTDPTNGMTAHKCSNASMDLGLKAADAAARAFALWKASTPATRRNIFLKASTVMDDRLVELRKYMLRETGCSEQWADFNIQRSKECLLDCAAKATNIEGRIPTLEKRSTGGLILKEPYGVILAMAPWNAPYILGFRAVAFAIAAGNTVVLKGSELCPRTMWAIASVFRDAGLPDGVLNFIVCTPAAAPGVVKALVDSPLVKKINFTGSTHVGRAIGQMAAANTKPTLLELGGKAPVIVCEDADLDLAARYCVLGAFLFSGQVCMSTERILVARTVNAIFEEKLREWVERLFPTNEQTFTLRNELAVKRNLALVKDALDKGARVISMGINDSAISSTRMRPVIVADVQSNMDIYKTESFGPTVSVIQFDTEDEATSIANDTEYGLTSSIFTQDLRKALRLATRIETGAVHINNMTIHDEPALPHGGAKSSGYGRFGGDLDEWLRTKNITYDI